MYSVFTTYIVILLFINLFSGHTWWENGYPGFNANFCKYVLINNDNLDITDVLMVDKREVGLKSTNMKKKV